MSDQTVQPKIEVTVDAATAFGLRLQEFDKVIAESEAHTADLKKQRAVFVYDTNLNAIMARAQTPAQQAAPQTPDQTPAPQEPAKE